MRIIILTSNLHGIASIAMRDILKVEGVEVLAVVHFKSFFAPSSPIKRIKRRLKKIKKIGLWGAFLGVYSRKNYEFQRAGAVDNLNNICKEHGIPFIQSPYTNSNETLSILENYSPDLALSLGNGYIAKRIFSSPKYGTINIHHELLPEYPGGASIIWPLYFGKKKSGYTIHCIDQKIDTGDILYRGEFDIKLYKTFHQTILLNSFNSRKLSVDGLVKVLKNFDNYMEKRTPQLIERSFTTPSFRQYVRIRKNYRRMRMKKNTVEQD